MALTLTKETGAGVANANSYADRTDADAYHEASLYADSWTAASDPNKEKALVSATRTIENAVQFYGYRNNDEQSLEWPRSRVPRLGGVPRGMAVGMGQVPVVGPYWPNDEIPPKLVEAVCELAKQLLTRDVTADPDGKGIKRVGLGQGAIDVEFDKSDTPFVLSDELQRMLAGLGVFRGQGSRISTGRA